MFGEINGMKVHLCGSFTDKDNACKFCENFSLWGVSTGHCRKHDEDMSCNNTCEHFTKDENWEDNCI